MAQWSYGYTAGLVRKLGFETLSQLDECISGYNDDVISHALWGARQGQLSRFEDMLLAGMGEHFISRHPWSRDEDWPKRFRVRLKKIAGAGITVRAYDPKAHEVSKQKDV